MEAHSHPKVNGIVLWGAWSPEGCYQMCLTDNNFKNLPTGDVVDKLQKQWGSMPLSGRTDSEGFFEASLFHGKYSVKVTGPGPESLSLDQTFEIRPTEEPGQTEFVTIVST